MQLFPKRAACPRSPEEALYDLHGRVTGLEVKVGFILWAVGIGAVAMVGQLADLIVSRL